MKKYKWSFCGDEFFVASELATLPDQFKLHDCKNLLYVVFQYDTPRSFTLEERGFFTNQLSYDMYLIYFASIFFAFARSER